MARRAAVPGALAQSAIDRGQQAPRRVEDFPAAVVSELELNGYAVERVYEHGRLIGVRLLQPEPPDTPAAHPGHRRRRWRQR
jgi:hypothetical protein